MAEFVCHSEKQERAIFSTKRITLVGTGTQWGKTLVGALRMKEKMFTFTQKTDSFIITAPDYKTMHQSTLKAFLPLMEGYGTYNKQLQQFEMHHGGICYFRTETDPDSIVGITNVRHIWGDEAGKYRLYFWENMQARADFLHATIDLTTSPYALNWVYRDLIKPWRNGKRPDVEVIHASSWENPYHSLHDPIKRKAKKDTMDERRFAMLFGGEWGQMVGRVYDCFDEDLHIVAPFHLPTGTVFYAGVDWGTTHPFVIVVRAITPTGMHYQVSEFYKTGLSPSDMVEAAQKMKKVWDIKTFFCDPAQPGNILEFNKNRLTAVAANNDITYGVGQHYDLIKQNKYRVFKDSSQYTLDEYEVYHYPEPEDPGPDDDDREQTPVDQNNHTMDANRYVTVHTFHAVDKKKPHVPFHERQETQEARIKRLKSRNRNQRTEKWSKAA